MKPNLRAPLLVAALAAAACSAPGAAPTFTPRGEQPASFTQFALPAGFRRVCEPGADNAVVHCDALIGLRIGGAAPTGLGPADLQSAYKLPSSTRGTGQTIALVDAFGYPSAEADLAKYRAHYGLPACSTQNGCFRKVNQLGQPGPYPRRNGSWDQEQALDVDMVSAACPNCSILLVEADRPSIGSLGAAVDEAVALGANVVSNSYGGGGRRGSQHYDHPGTIVVASSGDAGYGVQIPAGFPTVVSVGGTTLLKAGNRRGWSETVWGGSGSGCTPFAKPAWQTESGCSQRTMNDVAAVASAANGIAVYIHGWQIFAGTSVAAPLVAATYGLAENASSLDAAQSLYASKGGLFDVTRGSNGTCSPSYLCTAGRGYDGPTGNGTPDGIGAF